MSQPIHWRARAGEEAYLQNKRDAARYLGVSLGSLERLMRSGLAYIRVGNLVKFRPEDLADFVERHRVQHPKDAP
jgi:excisionase family DNA binding protein